MKCSSLDMNFKERIDFDSPNTYTYDWPVIVFI